MITGQLEGMAGHVVAKEARMQLKSAVADSTTDGRGLRQLGVLALFALAAWMTVSAYQTPAAKQCLAQYRTARTLADTARVNALVPDVPGNRNPDAHSCGFTRRMARWSP